VTIYNKYDQKVPKVKYPQNYSSLRRLLKAFYVSHNVSSAKAQQSKTVLWQWAKNTKTPPKTQSSTNVDMNGYDSHQYAEIRCRHANKPFCTKLHFTHTLKSLQNAILA